MTYKITIPKKTKKQWALDNIDNKAVVQENDQWDCKVCSFLSENLRNTQLKQSQQQDF